MNNNKRSAVLKIMREMMRKIDQTYIDHYWFLVHPSVIKKYNIPSKIGCCEVMTSEDIEEDGMILTCYNRNP